MSDKKEEFEDRRRDPWTDCVLQQPVSQFLPESASLLNCPLITPCLHFHASPQYWFDWLLFSRVFSKHRQQHGRCNTLSRFSTQLPYNFHVLTCFFFWKCRQTHCVNMHTSIAPTIWIIAQSQWKWLIEPPQSEYISPSCRQEFSIRSRSKIIQSCQ